MMIDVKQNEVAVVNQNPTEFKLTKPNKAILGAKWMRVISKRLRAMNCGEILDGVLTRPINPDYDPQVIDMNLQPEEIQKLLGDRPYLDTISGTMLHYRRRKPDGMSNIDWNSLITKLSKIN